MTGVLGEGGEECRFEPMLEVELGVEELRAEWLHCDCIANYLASMVSHNRSDSIRHANLFSSAINELLEIAFHATHRTGGRVICRVMRQHGVERVALTFPGSETDLAFYEGAVGRATAADVGARYLSALSGDVAPDRGEILAGLVLECNARLSVMRDDAQSVTLLVDLPLEGLVS